MPTLPNPAHHQQQQQQQLEPPAAPSHPQARRRRMAQRLGFGSARAFARWEDEVVVDHFASFVCEYLAPGYTVVPALDDGFAAFVGLEGAAAERVRMLEASRFVAALDPERGDWTARDYYKHFIVGVVADDAWLASYGIKTAKLAERGWSARKLTRRMVELLEFLIQEWLEGPGDDALWQKRRVGGADMREALSWAPGQVGYRSGLFTA